MKRTLMSFVVVAVYAQLLCAGEFRTPLMLRRGHIAPRFDMRSEEKFFFAVSGGLYSRTADKAYGKHGSNTVSLTRLLLGEDTFTLADVLGCVHNTDEKVFTTPIALDVDYTERGVLLNSKAAYHFLPQWYVGLRTSLPLREMRMVPIACAALRVQQGEVCDCPCLLLDDHEGLRPELLLERRGMCLGVPQRHDGFGDFDTEFSVGFKQSSAVCFEARFNVSWPVGRDKGNTARVFEVPPGNNGHFELMPGAWIGARLGKCLLLSVDGSYAFVLSAHERRAAAFAGSLIKNIGVPVNARTSWGYFWGHVDCSLRPKDNENIALTVGYELYLKTRDNARFVTECAQDIWCTVRKLNAAVLKKRTDRIAHKVRGELFFSMPGGSWTFGASYVVLGRHVPRELDFYVSGNVQF